MRFLFVLPGTVVLLATAGCRATSQVPAPAPAHPQAENLPRTWRHSQEEDRGVVQVYRLATYALPPARGRDGYIFAPGGQLTKLVMAPTDGGLPLPGRWRWANAHALHLSFDSQSQPDYRLKVLELTSEVLKVSVIEPR